MMAINLTFDAGKLDKACGTKSGGGIMAKKKGVRLLIKMKSTESGHMYLTEKNRRNDPQRLELRRYDPFVRKHVIYRETK